MQDDSSQIIRIAMWSGPRNISTAMMRSWENRPDTAVVDEPFYACYLSQTGIIHPMQDEVLASQSSSWNEVIAQVLQCDLGNCEQIQYQKHMTQHMVGEIDTEWFASLKHAFLIRDPHEVAASYGVKRETITADDIGFAKQKELYDLACAGGQQKPPVIDSKDVLQNPVGSLTKLCESLGVSFDANMLQWPAGKRDSDGVWAPHWYQSVERSTEFSPYQAKQISLNSQQQRAADESQEYYQEMYQQRLRV